MAHSELYDTALLGILQNEGEIVKFLDVFFSFLFRKTDFYLLLEETQNKMGFAPGVAKKLVLSAFKKYEAIALQNLRRQKPTSGLSTPPAPKPDAPSEPPVEVVEEVVTTSSPSEFQQPATASSASSISTTPPQPPCSNDLHMTASDGDRAGTQADSASRSNGVPPSVDMADSKTEDGEDDSELTKLQKQFQANPESYNGAVRDHYVWSQSIGDVDIRVKVPPHIRRGADVKVDIGKKKLRVAFKDASGTMFTAIDGELTWDIHPDEAIWTLVPGEHIHVNLEKVQERWWDAVLVNEQKINVRKIDASRPMTDLDEEAQAKIDELMYNDRQKKLGLPQSHEKKVHEMLKQAWDAEGSPFKGTPFDPSIVNVTPNS